MVVFRFKYGTTTGNVNPVDTGKEYKSGMEENFFRAYDLWKKHSIPEIMIFRSKEDAPQNIALKYNELMEVEMLLRILKQMVSILVFIIHIKIRESLQKIFGKIYYKD